LVVVVVVSMRLLDSLGDQVVAVVKSAGMLAVD
jgi:hypothetical protein